MDTESDFEDAQSLASNIHYNMDAQSMASNMHYNMDAFSGECHGQAGHVKK
jgi:hypothetical protein